MNNKLNISAAHFFKKINSPVAVSIIIAVMMLWRVLFFYGTPYGVLVNIIPDDAFYYIEMTRHRAFDGWWTFDGISPTTGFHFLYAHFLALIYQLLGDVPLSQLYLIISLIASLSIAFSAFLICSTARNVFGYQAIWLSAVPFLFLETVAQSTNMMESWLTLLFLAATLYKVLDEHQINVNEVLLLVLIGLLGSLSRSDFGMIPGVIFIIDCIIAYFIKNDQFKKSGLILLGAIVGLIISSINNFFIAGHFLSASAEVKYIWSARADHDFSTILRWAIHPLALFDFTSTYVRQLFGTSLLVVFIYRIFVANYKNVSILKNKQLVLSFYCIIIIASYLFLYKYNCRGIQNWYYVQFIAPFCFLLAAAVIFLFRKKSFLITAILVVIYGGMCIKTRQHIIYPENAGKMNAGLYIKQQPQPARYAALNAGIISYFSNHNVVNIDGLANDEIFPYIKENTVFDYLIFKKIDYIIDYELQITNPYPQLLFGYQDDRINRCLFSSQYVDGGAPAWNGSRIKLFQIIKSCGIEAYEN